MTLSSASRTAVFVAQGRAVADARLAVGRFSDPVAQLLLSQEERTFVQWVRAEDDARAGSWAQRMGIESLRACAGVLAPRTVAIDDAVTDGVGAGRCIQVGLLGAGLDSRVWRMPQLADATVFSVDHPASQAETWRRSQHLPSLAARLVFVPADLTHDDLSTVLDQAGHRPTEATAWIWEGVIPYLSVADVTTTLTAITARSGPGSLLAANYQTSSVVTATGQRLLTLAGRVTGLDHPSQGEPWRSTWTPARLQRLLTQAGMRVRWDRDLYDIAHELGTPTQHARSLRNGRVLLAEKPGA